MPGCIVALKTRSVPPTPSGPNTHFQITPRDQKHRSMVCLGLRLANYCGFFLNQDASDLFHKFSTVKLIASPFSKLKTEWWLLNNSGNRGQTEPPSARPHCAPVVDAIECICLLPSIPVSPALSPPISVDTM